MKRDPDNQEVIEMPHSYGSVHGDSTSTAIVKWLAGFGALLAATAIGFAYGRIFDHESRISGLEAVEKYKEEQKHEKVVLSAENAHGRP